LRIKQVDVLRHTISDHLPIAMTLELPDDLVLDGG